MAKLSDYLTPAQKAELRHVGTWQATSTGGGAPANSKRSAEALVRKGLLSETGSGLVLTKAGLAKLALHSTGALRAWAQDRLGC